MASAAVESELDQMGSPELERLLRNAAPRELRAFAVACGRLATRITEHDQPKDVTPALRWLDIAALMIQDVPDDDPDIVQARGEARAAAIQSDEAQLDLLGELEEEAEKGNFRRSQHPRNAAYILACRCAETAEIVAHALLEDAFEGAVECAHGLHRGLRIDIPTIVAIARAHIAG